MDRLSKERAKKRAEKRKGLSETEIEKLDREEKLLEQAEELAQKLHGERFPEEYDQQLDSSLDAKERRMGKNPMSADYAQRVNERRVAMGFEPLRENGLPADIATWKAVLEEAKQIVSKDIGL